MCAEIDKLAKQAVYFLHKGDHDKADQQLKTAGKLSQLCLVMLSIAHAATAHRSTPIYPVV